MKQLSLAGLREIIDIFVTLISANKLKMLLRHPVDGHSRRKHAISLQPLIE